MGRSDEFGDSVACPRFSVLRMSDFILFNANAITMDPARPSAQLVAIEGGKISQVAGNEMLGVLKSKKTQILDCAGKTLLPGFIDAHCHVHAYAENLVSLNLSPGENIHSIPDIQDRIRALCQNLPPGTWIRGKAYNEFYLSEKRHPNRRDLDAAAPLHPVKLTHRSGHAHVLNSLALKMAAIDEETGDPPGSLIDRDISGLPTGILYGFGGYLAKKIPALEDEDLERGVGLVNQKLISYGITSIQDASSVNGPDSWRRFEKWKTKGILQPRVTMMTGGKAFLDSDCKAVKACGMPALPVNQLRPGGVKIIADEITGSLHPSAEELNDAVAAIHEAGLQAAIHAIEEPVIEAAANAVESVLKKIPRRDHRHRIEHCSLCRPALLRRLARLGIAIVTQPAFIYYNGGRYRQTVPGDQLEFLYPVRSMLEHGILLGAGSDFPVVDPNPLVSIHAAVTRQTEEGAVVSQQRISVLDAIRMHTIGAAAAGFEEGIKGSLSPGKLADIVMLSENPFEVDPDQLKNIRVVMTIIGDRIIPNS